MSDSSEDEDLSRFKDAVDTTFDKFINESRGNNKKESDLVLKGNKKSDRYLEVSTHYNDIKVPEEMQKKIGDKISAIIGKSVEFVTPDGKIKKRKIKGGIKLFTDSENFLSCDEAKDTETELHNIYSKKIKNQRRRHVDDEINVCDEDKVKQVAVSGEFIMSKEETKTWKSRRKKKIFKYKSNSESKVLTAVE